MNSHNNHTMTLSTEENLAIALFDAYNSTGPNPWKTWDGKDVLRWQDLNDQVRGKWIGVAMAAMHRLGVVQNERKI